MWKLSDSVICSTACSNLWTKVRLRLIFLNQILLPLSISLSQQLRHHAKGDKRLQDVAENSPGAEPQLNKKKEEAAQITFGENSDVNTEPTGWHTIFLMFSATLWIQISSVTVWLNEKLEWNRSWSSHPSSLTSTESEISFWLDWCLHCWLFQDTAKILEGGIKVYFPVGMKNYLSEAETCSQKGEIPQTVHPAYFHQKVKHLTTMFLVQNKQDIFIKVSL